MTHAALPPKPLSPCVNICVMDDVTGLCSGCGRTLEEIAQWAAMPQEERLRVIALLPQRLVAAREIFKSPAG